MDKEAAHIHSMYITIHTLYSNYSAIQRNIFESVLMRWINLSLLKQNDVSQKEKNKYHVLMHIYGIQKNGTNEPLGGEGMEMQI